MKPYRPRTSTTTLTFIRDGRGGEPDIEDEVMQATPIERKRVGIPKGNGTVVSFDIASGTPQFNRFKDSLTNYDMLRRLNSDESRTVIIRNETTGEQTQLTYKPPVGEQVATETRKIKIGVFDFELEARVFLASEDLDQAYPTRRKSRNVRCSSSISAWP